MTKGKEKDNQSKPDRSPISQRQLNPCTPENILSRLDSKHSRYLKPPHAHSSTLHLFPSPKKSSRLHIWWQVLPAFLYTFTSFECTSKGCAIQFPSLRNKNQYNHSFRLLFNFPGCVQLSFTTLPVYSSMCVLHMRTYMCASVYAGTRAHTGKQRPEVGAGMPSSIAATPYILKEGISLNLKLTNLTRLPWDLPSSIRQCLCTENHYAWLLGRGWRSER